MAEDADEGGYNCGFGTNIWNNSKSDPAALYDAAGQLVDRLEDSMSEESSTVNETIEAEDRRFLVLGSAPHSRLVTAYTWDNLPEDLNVADHDVVILNFVPLIDETFARSIDVARLPPFDQFARLLFSQEGEVVAVGLPEYSIGTRPFRDPQGGGCNKLPTPFLTGETGSAMWRPILSITSPT